MKEKDILVGKMGENTDTFKNVKIQNTFKNVFK